MNRVLFLTILVSICALVSNDAYGQLFGARSVKRSLSRQGNSTVGQVEGNERFVRGRRGRQSFVGADQNDVAGFVGNEQGRTSGRIASPTGGMEKKIDRSSQINRPYPALRKTDVYPSILLLPADLLQNQVTASLSLQQAEKWNLELKRKVNDSISVSVANRSATLRGVVGSAREKSLAELLIRFEPGIDEVQNEIAVENR